MVTKNLKLLKYCHAKIFYGHKLNQKHKSIFTFHFWTFFLSIFDFSKKLSQQKIIHFSKNSLSTFEIYI